MGSPPHYDADSDLLEIHRAVLREAPEPTEGRERGPWWLWATIFMTVFAGGFYLGRYGDLFFQYRVHKGYVPAETVQQPGSAATVPAQNAPSDGKWLYQTHCQVCHQENGQGLPGAFPPLAGSEWVTGPSETVTRILLHGIQGPLSVKGAQYSGAMPAWKDRLSDEDIAAVATYVRTTWGNQAAAVPREEPQSLREKYASRAAPWTEGELRAAAAEEDGKVP